jgi:O-antigen/teichoic acid export membrane protein
MKTIATINVLLSRSLYKNASYLILGSLSTSVIGFIFVISATKLYSAEAVGLSTAAISSISLISLISELGLGITIIRFLPNFGKDSNNFLNFCLTINCIASILITAVFLVGLKIWSPDLLEIRQNIIFLLVFVIFAIASSLQPLILNVFLARRKAKYIMIINIIAGILKIVLIIIVSVVLNSAFGIFVGSGIAMIVAVFLLIFLYVPKVQNAYHPTINLRSDKAKELFSYSISNYIGRFLLQALPLIMPLIVLNNLGAEASANYYVAWTIGAVLVVIPTSIFNSLFAESSNDNSVSSSNVIRSVKFMLLLSVPVVVIVVILADKFLLLFGQSYSNEATNVLKVFALSTIPWGINYLYISIARSGRQLRELIFVAGLAMVLSLVMSYVLMSKLDLLGVGLGYLIGQSICAIIVIFFLKSMLSRWGKTQKP